MTTQAPKGEHEVHFRTDFEFYYPDHVQRAESSIFRATKEHWHKMGAMCLVCKTKEKVEIHHQFIEWADTNGTDWDLVKAEHPDFDWANFKEPAYFIDSIYNTVPLCEKHHRAPAPFGVHFTPGPIWNIQRYKKKDFVYTDAK